jgi:hypothetical protein
VIGLFCLVAFLVGFFVGALVIRIPRDVQAARLSGVRLSEALLRERGGVNEAGADTLRLVIAALESDEHSEPTT